MQSFQLAANVQGLCNDVNAGFVQMSSILLPPVIEMLKFL